MDWLAVAIAAGIIAAILVFKRVGLVSPQVAREHLKQGAKVIDVRSVAEFESEHLPNVANLPLGEIEDGIARFAPNKETVLLLHCQAGKRSAMAKRALKRMGYAKVFNLGSYRRAERILHEAGAQGTGAPSTPAH